MELNQNCEGGILYWERESMESGIEKSGAHCKVLCELGLPPRDSILKSDHQGQRGVMGYCVSTDECWVNSASSYRLIPKRGGGSRGGLQTGFPISSDSNEMSDFTESESDHRVTITSTVECMTGDAFFRSTWLREILFASDCHLKQIDGFQGWTSLCRIEIPSSVEIITEDDFPECLCQ
jgi:hypothetical protein